MNDIRKEKTEKNTEAGAGTKCGGECGWLHYLAKIEDLADKNEKRETGYYIKRKRQHRRYGANRAYAFLCLCAGVVQGGKARYAGDDLAGNGTRGAKRVFSGRTFRRRAAAINRAIG